MDSAKQQLVDRLKSASNILVTVSHDPSVDQLAALLGLTLLLNKQGKHSVAVFSGQVPSTIEFLEPENTIEKNTDSLRDFIIALDKNKADKLRYKVEDDVVRIFITPYKTSISQEDLEFSQGDFNVDVVVALGVKQQQDLDDAITAHGRILHDATVASINLGPDGGLGTINWHDPQASSLSELVTDLALALGDNSLDNQIATALLTGIVAETERFRNDKTTSQTMTASSALMAAGANQQLVASKLEEPQKAKSDEDKTDDSGSGSGQDDQKDGDAGSDDGTLSIDHDGSDEKSGDDAQKDEDKPADSQAPSELPAPQLSDEDNHQEDHEGETSEPSAGEHTDHVTGGTPLVTEPPQLGGTLSANTKPETLEPTTDPLSVPNAEPGQLLSRPVESGSSSVPAPGPASPLTTGTPASDAPASPGMPAPAAPTPVASWTPPPVSSTPMSTSPVPPPVSTPASSPHPQPGIPPDGSSPTLSELEQSVNSPHTTPPKLDDARDEVTRALSGSAPSAPTPIQALNAQPLGDDLHPPKQDPLPEVKSDKGPPLPFGPTPPESSDTNPQPGPSPDSLSPSPQVNNPATPPPVPPPMPFDFSKQDKPATPPNQSVPPL